MFITKIHAISVQGDGVIIDIEERKEGQAKKTPHDL